MTSPKEQQLLDPCKTSIATTIFDCITKLMASVETGKAPTLTRDDIFKMVEKPKDSGHGDYAFPCFRFAKPLGKSPADIAKTLAEQISSNEWIDKFEVVGAFINMHLNRSLLQKYLFPKIVDDSFFKVNIPQLRDEKLMVEYSQPNTHKEFHVGHTRNVCLGDSLVRLSRYLGFPVIAANYIGDEGVHIAKCLWQYHELGPVPEGWEKNSWLAHCYVQAGTKLAEANEQEKAAYEKRIGEILAEMESKSGTFYALWQETRQWSLDTFAEIYNDLDVKFDHYFYESEMTDDAQAIVTEYLDKGLFEESEGAIGLNLDPYKLGYLIVRKSDGNTLYATKDLALAKIKFNDFDIKKSIYVVAEEQKHHFKQVFKALDLMGFAQAKNCYHLSYGMVVRPDGKMSSRKGNSFTHKDLLKEIQSGLNAHMEKYTEEWTKDEIESCVHLLTFGAVKYGMLRTDPHGEIVFNLEDWLSFEGNTGPYLMYSYARGKSILRKANESDFHPHYDENILLNEDIVNELLRYFYDFNLQVLESCNQAKPSLLANHLYYMAKTFNRFYNQVPILKSDDKALIEQRLVLVELFTKTLKTGLDLLGIEPPERM